MVFRVLDAKGRSTELVLIPVKHKNTQSQQPEALTLRLSYKQNPFHPDIFQIPKGNF